MEKMQINLIDVDSLEKEFNDLKKALIHNKYTDSETDDLVFNFLLHCRRLIYMIRKYPEQIEAVERIEEIESKAMEHWPTVKLEKLQRSR